MRRPRKAGPLPRADRMPYKWVSFFLPVAVAEIAAQLQRQTLDASRCRAKNNAGGCRSAGQRCSTHQRAFAQQRSPLLCDDAGDMLGAIDRFRTLSGGSRDASTFVVM